jgi:dihydropteroate synthase
MQAIAERLQPIRHALGARTLVMGVLNTTPDSFYDGGRYAAFERALARAEQMLAEGADILDIGGESTRPGAEPVPEDEELRRTVPVIEAIAARYPQRQSPSTRPKAASPNLPCRQARASSTTSAG